MSFKYPAYFVLALAVALVAWGLVLPHDFTHFFGIDTQQSDNYDFVSGVGPMVVTFLFGSSVFATLWAHLNCHIDGCPHVGRFKVAGGYLLCSNHHAQVTGRHRKHLTVSLMKDLHRKHTDPPSGPDEGVAQA